jgi:hypothetical protein
MIRWIKGFYTVLKKNKNNGESVYQVLSQKLIMFILYQINFKLLTMTYFLLLINI